MKVFQVDAVRGRIAFTWPRFIAHPPPGDRTLQLHMYADFGKEDTSRNSDTTTPLTSRLVSPVYLHSNTGKMFTAPDKQGR